MSKRIGLDISVLSDKNKTGVGVYTYGLIKSILEQNRKDKFILFGFSTLDTFEYLKNIEFKKYPNVEIKVIKMPAKIFRTVFLLWQKIGWPKIEDLIGPVDIYHSFNFYLPPQKNGKVVATIFDMTPNLFPNLHTDRTVQLDTIRFNRIKKYTDLTLAISENSKKDFLKYSPYTKVEVIYPGVSENFLDRSDYKMSKQVLRKYNLEQGYILSVGTLEPRKNIKNLIEAYLKSNLKQKLVLVGKWGWENSDLAELINANKDRIITTGFVSDSDIPHLYNQALLFIYPSLYEGFGIPVLEALTLGVPVICSKGSSLVEVGGDSVLYINPKDVKDISNKLTTLVKDKNLRNKLSKKGKIQAKKFSWKKSAQKLNSLYKQSLKGKLSR